MEAHQSADAIRAQLQQEMEQELQRQLATMRASFENRLQQQIVQQEALQRQLAEQAALAQERAAATAGASSSPPPGQQPPLAVGLDADALTIAQARLAALPTLQPFSGKGAAAGLEASEWLTDAEFVLEAREELLGTKGSARADRERVLLATQAMRDDARAWYRSLGASVATWADFKKQFSKRYQCLPSLHLLEAQLEQLVADSERRRDKMTIEQLQHYSTRFVELANRLPADCLTNHTKLKLYARGLKEGLRRYVVEQHMKDTTPMLHEVVQEVLRRAALRNYAAAGAAALAPSAPLASASSSSPTSGDAMDLGAAELLRAADVFGISREQAMAYLQPAEGWAPHDTGATEDRTTADAPSVQPWAAALNAIQQQQAAFQQQVLNALSQGSKSAGRRSVAPATKAVPEELAKARTEAGLCIRCGVHKYEPGTRGHNSRTCRLPVDKTTTVTEGRRKAGF
jgi:hypothetical protein